MTPQLDIIGELRSHTSGQIIPGWHVNTTQDVAEWAEYKVDPLTPSREFLGVPTHRYTFPDQAAFEAAAAEVGINTQPANPEEV